VALSLPAQSESEGPKASGKEVAAKPAEQAKAAEKKAVDWVMIQGGVVIPVSGPIIAHGRVLLKDGKIEAIGRDLVAPAGARIIDATGKYVCPGFVAVSSSGALGLQGLVPREMAKDQFNPYSDVMLMCLASGITTAHQGPGGRGGFAGMMGGSTPSIFSGTTRGVVSGAIGKLTYGSVNGFELRQPAGVYMNYPTRSPSDLLEMRDALEKAVAFAKNRDAWMKDVVAGKKDAKEPKADEGTVALADCLRGEQVLFMSAEDEDALRGCLDLMDEFRIPMVLCGAQEGWLMAPEIGRRPASVIMTPRGNGGMGLRPYRQPYVDKPHGWSLTAAHKLSQAGVPWATVTMGNSVVTSLFVGRDLTSLPFEAAFAVRGGATNEEALESITLTAARILKVDDRVGSLDVGKDGDILIMDREPMDYRSMVDLVLVNGKVVYDRSTVSFWDHIQTDRSAGLKPWAPWGPWPKLQTPEEAAGSGGQR
jgi:hypothetical protein